MDIEKENTLLKKELASLKEVESNFYFFLENTPDFIYFKDKNHCFTFASNSFAALTKHNSGKELVGKNDFDIFPEEHAKAYVAGDKSVMLDREELIAFEEPYYNEEGKLCWVSTSKKPIFNDKNELIGLFGISRDITKMKALEADLSNQAHYDDLTSLANRAFFLEQSNQFLHLAIRNSQSIALFFIDLDGFKLINDKYGHKAGDFVLESVSKRLKKVFRKSDILGRLGGDEFAVLIFFDGKEVNLNHFANKTINTINQPIQFENFSLEVGCSIGVSSFPSHGENLKELLSKADEAMYIAKNSGKNTCVFFKEK